MKFWRTIFALVSMLGAGSALLWPRIARPQQSQRVPTIEEYNHPHDTPRRHSTRLGLLAREVKAFLRSPHSGTETYRNKQTRPSLASC